MQHCFAVMLQKSFVDYETSLNLSLAWGQTEYELTLEAQCAVQHDKSCMLYSSKAYCCNKKRCIFFLWFSLSVQIQLHRYIEHKKVTYHGSVMEEISMFCQLVYSW